MATKLPVNHGGTHIGRKIWDLHQKNEYTRVNNYKEALCFRCFKKDVAAAMVVDMCEKCSLKCGVEAKLVVAGMSAYGMCYMCGVYQFNIAKINARFCRTCFDVIRKRLKTYNKGGGPYHVDPFWKSVRRKLGKDWQILFSPPRPKKL